MKRALVVLWLLAVAGGSVVAASKEIIFCAYNVRNYVNASPAGPGQKYGSRAKPQKEIDALIQVIREINPDILGVCEMGTPDRFEDFQKRLKEAGLGYVDSEYVQGPDPERHLALVSRFPIVAHQSLPDESFELNGRREKVKRGFLDVTIEVRPDYRLRAVGVHLKSKLPVPEGEALIRRHEAQKLRQHLEKIFTADRQVNLIAYGDFNDTKNEPMFAEVTGVKGSPTYMADLWARDSFGDRWTHYWRVADQYARLDYLFVSPALFREVVLKKSTVYRSPIWGDASDHRPIYTSIIPVNRE